MITALIQKLTIRFPWQLVKWTKLCIVENNIAASMYQHKWFNKLNEFRFHADKGYYQKVYFNSMEVICVKENNASK